MKIKRYSPFLAKFQILKRGSGNHQKNITFYAEKYKDKQNFNTPIIKGGRSKRLGDSTKDSKKNKKSKVVLDDTRF